MKFILLSTLVVFCTASTLYRGKNISVNEDGSVVITSSSGKSVLIDRSTWPNGQNVIDISILGPSIPTKRIQIDEDNNIYGTEVPVGYPWPLVNTVDNEQLKLKTNLKKGKTQGDVLYNILKEYQGTVYEPLFVKLLSKVDKAVKKGEISPQIYDLLVGLDEIDDIPVLSGQNGLGLYEFGVGSRGYGAGPVGVLPLYNSQLQKRLPIINKYQVPVPQRGIGLAGNSLLNLEGKQILGSTRYINPVTEGQNLQNNQILDNVLVRQQLADDLSRLGQDKQNIVDDLILSQRLNGVGLQRGGNIVEGLLIGSSAVPKIYNTDVVGGIPVERVASREIPFGNNVLLKEYLTNSRYVPYSQPQKYRGLVDVSLNKPTGIKEGYVIQQRQPVILQNGRNIFSDNAGIPQY